MLNKKIKRKRWCECDRKTIELASQKERPKSKLVRCSTCKKRFETYVFCCGDNNCWHHIIPKHKRELKSHE